MGKLKYKYYTVIKRPNEYGKTEIQILHSHQEALMNMGKLKYKYYTIIKRPDEYGKTEIQILHNHQEA